MWTPLPAASGSPTGEGCRSQRNVAVHLLEYKILSCLGATVRFGPLSPHNGTPPIPTASARLFPIAFESCSTSSLYLFHGSTLFLLFPLKVLRNFCHYLVLCSFNMTIFSQSEKFYEFNNIVLLWCVFLFYFPSFFLSTRPRTYFLTIFLLIITSALVS